jgi:SAM-dependent methyltransferase
VDASEWDERYRSIDLVWGTEPNVFVRQECEFLPVGEAALDLACGEGRNALWLARLGWHVQGVDYSAAAIERAKSLTEHEAPDVAERLSWAVVDVTLEPPRPGCADLVLISYLHLPPAQMRALLLAAGNAVRPQGHLVIVGHDRRNLAGGVGGPQDAHVLHSPESLAAAASEAGLLVELADTVQRSTADGVALDTLLRARRPDG